MLADEGYDVEAVASGEECLQRLADQPCDLVFLDVWLEGIDGIETLERIRQAGIQPWS